MSRVPGMATAAMAGAAGAAVVLYYTGWGTAFGMWTNRSTSDFSEDGSSHGKQRESDGPKDISRRRVVIPKPSRAPSTWYEALSTLSETLRFTYSETLGKWPIGDLAFGINFLLRRQGHQHVAAVYAGEVSTQLRGPGVVAELRELMRLLTVCMHFSKKPFPMFLEVTGYTNGNVYLQEGKAGLLKPAFTVLVDDTSHCILLLIRGTHSVKDTLTAVTGAVVPFHHAVLDEGGVKNLVLGYAHCGMVAAARWIAQLATPRLLQALMDHPSYDIKVVGHSLGGGTAALLTYILRERGEFQSTHCVAFAPAACMTWELAESGLPFVTSVINGSDLVPTFSAASVDDLRAEVTASAWINDFREQIERTRILSTVFRSASALGSRLSSIASMSRASLPPYSSLTVAKAAQSSVASAGAIWRPVSSGTQVVMRQAQNVAQAVVRTRPSLGLSSWSCMGARRRVVTVAPSTSEDTASSSSVSPPLIIGEKSDTCQSGMLVEESCSISRTEVDCLPSSFHMKFHVDEEGHQQETEFWVTESPKQNEGDFSSILGDSGYGDEYLDHAQEDDEDSDLNHPGVGEDLGEEYIWQQLEQELKRQREDGRLGREEEEAASREITHDEENLVSAASESGIVTEAEKVPVQDYNRFYPPGRVMHVVCPLPEDSASVLENDIQRKRVGLFLTDRKLYGKIRLSRTMVHDHYMPTYKRMMEALIDELERECLDQGSELREEDEELLKAM